MKPTLTMIETGLAVLTVMGWSRSLSDRTMVERIYTEMESARLREQSTGFILDRQRNIDRWEKLGDPK